MNKEYKDKVSAHCRRYLAHHKLSQAAFSRKTGINASYLSNILNGKYEYPVSAGKQVSIPDDYFTSIAAATAMETADLRWKIVETPQFIQTVSALEAAKERSLTRLIIGESGCGKTMTINRFVQANPVYTFKITVSSLHRINNILDDIAESMQLKFGSYRAARIREISHEVGKIKLRGGLPIIIIDEAENLTPCTIGLCKALYDAVHRQCGLVLAGTDELIYKMERLERRNAGGILQFRRRFKAGTIMLEPITRRSYDPFLRDVEDPELRQILKATCSNYGELHDYLEPAMKAAATEGARLDAQYFRSMYYLGSNK